MPLRNNGHSINPSFHEACPHETVPRSALHSILLETRQCGDDGPSFPRGLNILLVLMLVLLLALPTAAAEAPFRIGIGFRAPVSEFCDKVMLEAFRRLDMTAEVLELPAERSIQMVNDGSIDAECTRIKGIEKLYPNLVQVTEPLLEAHFVGFVKGTQTRPAPGWAGLKPYRVGAVYGWKILEVNIPKVAPRSFDRVNTAESMFRMLDAGRIDIATMSLLDGLLWVHKLELREIRPVMPPLASKKLYFYLHRDHAHLKQPLARVIKEMKADGTWDNAEQQVFGPLLEGMVL